MTAVHDAMTTQKIALANLELAAEVARRFGYAVIVQPPHGLVSATYIEQAAKVAIRRIILEAIE